MNTTADGGISTSTTLVSLSNGSSGQGAARSFQPSSSRTGRFIAFTSSANNLVDNDINSEPDVFVRDRLRGQTVRISTPTESGGSGEPSISADGRFVAFTSIARGNVPDDGDFENDIFLKDRDKDEDGVFDEGHPGAVETTWVTPPTSASNFATYAPDLSADGRWLAFISSDPNLLSDGTDTNSMQDVLVWDGVTRKVVRVSVTSTGGELYRGAFGEPSISDDGRYVVFHSNSTDHGSDPHPGSMLGGPITDVVLHDRDADNDGVFDEPDGISNTYLTPDAARQDSAAAGVHPTISGNGRYVVYASNYGDPTTCDRSWNWYLHDREGTASAVATYGPATCRDGDGRPEWRGAIDDEGKHVAFTSLSATVVTDTQDPNAAEDVFVYETGKNRSTLVSATQDASGSGRSYQAEISADGRVALFTSGASDLVGPGNDTNAVDDVFARDVTHPGVPAAQTFGLGCYTGASVLGDANPSGCQGDPVNSATGAFVTSVTDLSLPGIGPVFTHLRTYTSADAAAGSLARGWSHSLESSLAFSPAGDATFTAPDGQQLVFTRQADGSLRAPAGAHSKLSAVTGGYVLRTAAQLRYRFDELARLIEINDRNNNGLTLSYNEAVLASVTDSVGRNVLFTHNAEGLLTKVALPDGRSVSYAYTNGLLTSVTDVRGGTTAYSYDAEGRLTTIVDQGGAVVVANVFEPGGRVAEQRDPSGNVTTFAWDAASQTSTMVDARGNSWRDVYLNNVLVARLDPLGNKTSFFYDADLNLIKVVDPRGHATKMTYDGRGNVLTRTAPTPLSHQETFTYNSNNDVTSYTDGRSNVTTYAYDNKGNLVSIDRPGPSVTTLGRDPSTGLVTAVTDPRGETSTFSRNTRGEVVTVMSPLGNKTTFRYDDAGRVVAVVDPRGNVDGADATQFETSLAYDAANHVTARTSPLGHVTRYSYDRVGNLTQTVDAKNRATGYAYNPARKLRTITAPDGTQTTYSYDSVGNLASRTEPNGHVTSYSYDPAHRLGSVTGPTGSRWTYGYDAAGNVSRLTDANGNATPEPGDGAVSYSYDPLGRLTSVDYSDATPDVSFGYDANSNRTSMTDAFGSETYAYDALDRLVGVTRDAKSFTYAYDASGSLMQRTYPDGTETVYAYDADGNLASAKSEGATTTYEYNPAGLLNKTTLPSSNGHSERRVYDRDGRLSEIHNVSAVGTLSSAVYERDSVGNPLAITTSEGKTVYGYDERHRLTRVCHPPGCGAGVAVDSTSYAYDAVGNRLSETTPTSTTTYAYDAADRLTSASRSGGATTTYDHDPNGNLTVAGSRSYTYDLAGRMTGATEAGTSTTYTYDGDGKRLRAVSGTAASDTTRYLWDVNFDLPELATERDGSGSLKRRYIYGTDLVSMTTPSSTSYYHYDGMGSVTNVTDAQGLPQWSYSYDPFGNSRRVTKVNPLAPDNPIRFTGEYLDPTGLYHLRARQYDPSLGRFTATDPVSPSMTDPYVSAYAYVNNRPTVLVDPSGEVPIAIPIFLGAAALATAAAAMYEQDPAALNRAAYEAEEFFRGFYESSPEAATASVLGEVVVCDGWAAGAFYRLPREGEPNSTDVSDDGNGKGQIRDYGPEGVAEKDFDFGHDHGAGDPHAHDWIDGVRQPGRPIRPGE